jgi:uncharacterized protein YggU (UPF0235/DUF167 family)
VSASDPTPTSPPSEPPPEGGPVSVGTEFERLTLGEHRGAVRFDVAVKPRSSRSAVLGVREGSLCVALRAAPADGAANDELRGLLARALEVRKGDVTIVLGASSRGKVVEVHGVSAAGARALLARAKR